MVEFHPQVVKCWHFMLPPDPICNPESQKLTSGVTLNNQLSFSRRLYLVVLNDTLVWHNFLIYLTNVELNALNNRHRSICYD